MWGTSGLTQVQRSQRTVPEGGWWPRSEARSAHCLQVQAQAAFTGGPTPSAPASSRGQDTLHGCKESGGQHGGRGCPSLAGVGLRKRAVTPSLQTDPSSLPPFYRHGSP